MSTELMTMPEPTAPAHRGGAAGVIHAMEELKAVRTFVASEMKKGLDFGVIPGAGDKPTLFLPGAQKIAMFFNTTPDFQVQATELGGGHVEYVVTARLHSRASGNVVGSGVGSCTTMEKKYRWRAGGIACPRCGVGLRKSKDKPEWYCWQKQGGCGATFPLNDPAVKGQSTGQVENPDIYDLRNTVLKMAKKRALVDASMGLGCLSELFTQDLEDIYDLGAAPAQEPRAAPAPESPRRPAGGYPTDDPGDYGGGPPRRDRGRPEKLSQWIDSVVGHWNSFSRLTQKGQREARRQRVVNHLATWAIGAGLAEEADTLGEGGKRSPERAFKALAVLYRDDAAFARMRAEAVAYLDAKRAEAEGPADGPEPEADPGPDGAGEAPQEAQGEP